MEPTRLERRRRALLAARAAGRLESRLGDVERRRRMRLQRHLAVGVVATAAFIAAVPFLPGLAAYVAAVGLFATAVGSLLRAAVLRFGYAWGAPHEAPWRVTRVDRLVVRILDRLRPEPAATGDTQVRELPPKPPATHLSSTLDRERHA